MNEHQRMQNRQLQRVRKDLAQLTRALRDDRSASYSTNAFDEATRADELASKVSRAEFLTLARVTVYLSAMYGLTPDRFELTRCPQKL